MDSHDNKQGSCPPWSRIPSLSEMSAAAGVDFDQLLAGIKQGESTGALAAKFGISEETMADLVNHFWHYGISSVIGGD